MSREVPRLQADSAKKFAPRQANDEASREDSPVAARGSTTPRHVNSTPRSRFSGNSPNSAAALSPNGGSTLFVSGMGSQPRRRASEAGSYMFRSSTSIADAHIKDTSLRVTPGAYPAARSTIGGNGTAAFRSKSPSDRDSHMKDLMNGTYASPRSTTATSPGRQHQLPSASFRSASPTACAHINALTKPVDATYDYNGRRVDRLASASFRSSTSIADAHIKASPKMHDGTVVTPRGISDKGCTSPFKSTTSIADAHIKAVPKPVDVVLAYRD